MGRSTFVDAATVDVDALGATILPLTEAGSTSGAAAPLPNGDDRYARGKALGQGGMGTVFEATDRQFGRTVALKQADATGSAAMARFSVEALVTANLEHPGVTPVYDRGVNADGKPFYTMARVHGRTLADLIAEATTVESRLKLLPVIVRVAQTLAYAHERGVVHRDIKPENIIVGRHGEAFVLDWGIAKVRGLKTAPGEDGGAAAPRLVLDDTATKDGATRAGSVLGTPAYMAPEQAAGRIDEVDERTDVFALGALLYHVVTGRPPYDAPTLRGIVDQAIAATPPPASTLVQGMPLTVHGVLGRAMARAREDRFQTAGDLALALETTMTDALTEKRSPAVRIAINALTLAGALTVCIAGGLSAMASSSFREQGWIAQVMLVLFLAGLALSGIEWRTRGRHDLSGLIAVFAGVTLLLAIGGTLMDLEAVFHYLQRPEVLADPAKWRSTLTEGVFESLGALPLGVVYTAVQLILWGVLTRQNAQATSRVAGG